MTTSRRSFLKGSVAMIGALMIPLGNSKPAKAAIFSESTTPPVDGATEINDWIWVDRDGNIILGVSQNEVGQGVYTGLPQVLADEMDADWERVTVRFVTGRDAYRADPAVVGSDPSKYPPQQAIAASLSVTNFYPRMRLAGAQARDLFLRAGANYLGVRPSQCQTRNGEVIHLATQRSVAYGDLLEEAAHLELDPSPQLKSASRQTMMGQNIARIDVPSKVDGSATFGIDVELPEMLIGVPRMVPSLTGRLEAITNEDEVRAMPGVHDLVITPHWPRPVPNTVIVIADSYWQAKQAADALELDVDPGPGAGVNSATIQRDNAAALAAEESVLVTEHGDPTRLLTEASEEERLVEIDFTTPYITHATMEPCTATADFQGEQIEMWGSFNGLDMIRKHVGRALELEPDQVKVNCTYLGGSFGRKYLPDAAVHAALASRAVRRPVKVIYSREEDTRHSYYRPGCASRFQAVLGEDGYPTALHARYAGQSLFAMLKKEVFEEAGGWDESMVECVYDMRYQIPNLRVEATDVKQPIPLSFLRGVGSVSSVFYLESMLNELARMAGIDEVEYRRHLLRGEAELLRVIDTTAEAAGWEQEPPAGIYRGFAFNVWTGRGMAFETLIALAVELRIDEGRVRVTRAVCGLDCGRAINPGLIKANIEGGIGFALTGVFKSELHFEEGAVLESNFDTYPLLNIGEMPDIEVVIVDSDRPPQGCGEVAMAVVAPAVASAMAKASSSTFHSMPFPRTLG